MTSTVEIRLNCIDQRGAPAAMVATWVMGELLSFADVGIRLENPEGITLEIALGDFERVRASLAALLREPRFARWVISAIPGGYLSSLPDSEPC
jgi:hypothetical protein